MIIKLARITHTSATLIDDIYLSTKCKPSMHSAILSVDNSEIIKSIHINETAKP